MTTPERIVDAILCDLCDRAGIGDEWEAIDHQTQEQIKQAWMAIIKKEMECTTNQS